MSEASGTKRRGEGSEGGAEGETQKRQRVEGKWEGDSSKSLSGFRSKLKGKAGGSGFGFGPAASSEDTGADWSWGESGDDLWGKVGGGEKEWTAVAASGSEATSPGSGNWRDKSESAGNQDGTGKKRR